MESFLTLSRNQGNVNWSDEVDENQKGYINNVQNTTSGNNQKKNRKSGEKREGFGRSHASSVNEKWTHDLFEQHENSDDDRTVSRARKIKSNTSKKALSSSKVSFLYISLYLHDLFSRIFQKNCD